jgi:hypothetical protein
VDGIMRRCVPEHEQQEIIRKCLSSPYGGHHAGMRTRAKVLQYVFYWPTLFKDVVEFKLVMNAKELQVILVRDKKCL